MLDVKLLGVRKADHRRRTGFRARGNHRFHISEFETAVLHLKPGVVVVLRIFAVLSDIEFRLRKAEDLFAVKELLFGRVVQRGFGRLRCGRLAESYAAGQGGDAEASGEESA